MLTCAPHGNVRIIFLGRGEVSLNGSCTLSHVKLYIIMSIFSYYLTPDCIVTYLHSSWSHFGRWKKSNNPLLHNDVYLVLVPSYSVMFREVAAYFHIPRNFLAADLPNYTMT
jgi:hypothetical protein